MNPNFANCNIKVMQTFNALIITIQPETFCMMRAFILGNEVFDAKNLNFHCTSLFLHFGFATLMCLKGHLI